MHAAMLKHLDSEYISILINVVHQNIDISTHHEVQDMEIDTLFNYSR